MRIVGRPPRDGYDIAIRIRAEMPHRRIAHEPAGAGDQDLFAQQDLLARHGSDLVAVTRR